MRLCGQGDSSGAVAQSERCLVVAVRRPCSRLNAARNVKVNRVADVCGQSHAHALGRDGEGGACAAFIEHIVAHIRAARDRGGGGIAAARVGIRLRAAHGEDNFIFADKTVFRNLGGGRLLGAVIGQLLVAPRHVHALARDGELNGGVIFQLIVAGDALRRNGGGVRLPFRIGVSLRSAHVEGEAFRSHQTGGGGGGRLRRTVIGQLRVAPPHADELGSYRINYLQIRGDIVAIFDDFDNDAVIYGGVRHLLLTCAYSENFEVKGVFAVLHALNDHIVRGEQRVKRDRRSVIHLGKACGISFNKVQNCLAHGELVFALRRFQGDVIVFL